MIFGILANDFRILMPKNAVNQHGGAHGGNKSD